MKVVKNIGGTVAITDSGDFVESRAASGKSLSTLSVGGAVMPEHKPSFLSKPRPIQKPRVGATTEQGDNVYIWFPLHGGNHTDHYPIVVGKIWPNTDGQLRLIDNTIAPKGEAGVDWEFEIAENVHPNCASYNLRGLIIATYNVETSPGVFNVEVAAYVTRPIIEYNPISPPMMCPQIVKSVLLLSTPESSSATNRTTIDIDFGTASEPDVKEVTVSVTYDGSRLSSWNISYLGASYGGSVVVTNSNTSSHSCSVCDDNGFPNDPDNWCYICTDSSNDSSSSTFSGSQSLLLCANGFVGSDVIETITEYGTDIEHYYDGFCDQYSCDGQTSCGDSYTQSYRYERSVEEYINIHVILDGTTQILSMGGTNGILKQTSSANGASCFLNPGMMTECNGCDSETASDTYSGYDTFSHGTALLFFDMYTVSEIEVIIAAITYTGDSYFGKAVKDSNNNWTLSEIDIDNIAALKSNIATFLSHVSGEYSTITTQVSTQFCPCGCDVPSSECSTSVIGTIGPLPVFTDNTIFLAPVGVNDIKAIDIGTVGCYMTGKESHYNKDKGTPTLVLNPNDAPDSRPENKMRPRNVGLQTYYGVIATNQFVESDTTIWGTNSTATAGFVRDIFDSKDYIIDPANPLGGYV